MTLPTQDELTNSLNNVVLSNLLADNENLKFLVEQALRAKYKPAMLSIYLSNTKTNEPVINVMLGDESNVTVATSVQVAYSANEALREFHGKELI